jgi:prefoldin subunit 5
VEQMNNELYEKDKTIEKLQKLLRAKQTEERERQFMLE